MSKEFLGLPNSQGRDVMPSGMLEVVRTVKVCPNDARRFGSRPSELHVLPLLLASTRSGQGFSRLWRRQQAPSEEWGFFVPAGLDAIAPYKPDFIGFRPVRAVGCMAVLREGVELQGADRLRRDGSIIIGVDEVESTGELAKIEFDVPAQLPKRALDVRLTTLMPETFRMAA